MTTRPEDLDFPASADFRNFFVGKPKRRRGKPQMVLNESTAPSFVLELARNLGGAGNWLLSPEPSPSTDQGDSVKDTHPPKKG